MQSDCYSALNPRHSSQFNTPFTARFELLNPSSNKYQVRNGLYRISYRSCHMWILKFVFSSLQSEIVFETNRKSSSQPIVNQVLQFAIRNRV